MATEVGEVSQWDSLIGGKEIMAAEFWAPWCPQCKRLNPVFESITSDFPDIRFTKVNVDEELELAARYGIREVPMIKFFCEAKEVGEIVGYLPKKELSKQIKKVSSNASECLANTSSIQ